ncbi:hypothetical protein AC579_557 [Pseudocercospora musae]|uniref:F-box domain-containing protein n=1 Tax=Pseudocercospora musae TaxID=113226 RepID=A0A139IRR1_9PEZI|nr:hypothetical protein AC579_557 [Pseudocercospora musae]
MGDHASNGDLQSILRRLPAGDLVQARQLIDSLLTPERLVVANQQLSPLLRLPRNVLEHIVELAVSYDGDISVDDVRREPGLLQACHKLRAEASRLYFSRNTFKRKRSLREQGLEKWAKVRVGEYRRHLKRVKLGPPLHCNNSEAEKEAEKLDTKCGVGKGTIWVLSDDDFENDYEWWVNSLGETEKIELEASEGIRETADTSTRAVKAHTVRPAAASWYCASWMARKDTPEPPPTDYFSLHKGLMTPQSRPSH